MENLLACAFIVFFGLIASRLIRLLNLPDVTAYLIAGILIGPSVFGLLSEDQVVNLELIPQVALSMIALLTGLELRFTDIKESGPKILAITCGEATGAFIAVTLAMLLIFKESVAFSITLGAISTATAPAATLMVIKQYKARGPLVDTLIPVVALDDGYCIMIFGICSTIAASLMKGAELSFVNMFLIPVLQILGALGLGILVGLITVKLLDHIKDAGRLTSYIFGVIFLLTYLANLWGLSSLLVMMAVGSTISNLTARHMRIINSIDSIAPTIFMMFFVLSGAGLDLSVLGDVGLIGLGYIIFRVLGKFTGAYVTSKKSGLPAQVYKNLGWTLFPQAGVAIGLSLIASKIIPPPYGGQIRTIVLAATIVYEILGPSVAKAALSRAGEISTKKDQAEQAS